MSIDNTLPVPIQSTPPASVPPSAAPVSIPSGDAPAASANSSPASSNQSVDHWPALQKEFSHLNLTREGARAAITGVIQKLPHPLRLLFEYNTGCHTDLPTLAFLLRQSQYSQQQIDPLRVKELQEQLALATPQVMRSQVGRLLKEASPTLRNAIREFNILDDDESLRFLYCMSLEILPQLQKLSSMSAGEQTAYVNRSRELTKNQSSAKVDLKVETEIAEIERVMKTQRAQYNKDEGMQARYRELLRMRGR